MATSRWRQVSEWAKTMTAVVAGILGLVASYYSYQAATLSLETKKEVKELAASVKPILSITFPRSDHVNVVGPSVSVTGKATPGTAYQYVFVAFRGTRPPNQMWRVTATAQLTDGAWRANVPLDQLPIEQEATVKAVLTRDPTAYKLEDSRNSYQTFPLHGTDGVPSNEILVWRTQ